MRPVKIPVDSHEIEGELILPDGAQSVVLFAHGSGSSRHSPRNQYVAGVLREAGIGTLLFDLLTPREDSNYQTRFDIGLLTERLLLATGWLSRQKECADLGLGYFGASTGAAAALQAAADLEEKIRAVVSRGGRPDLAMESLGRVVSPTLLVVGGWDDVVIEFNRKAFAALNCTKKLVIVPEATHLFEEPGKLEEVARLAVEWFAKHLA